LGDALAGEAELAPLDDPPVAVTDANGANSVSGYGRVPVKQP
jgi:hypothetical protein